MKTFKTNIINKLNDKIFDLEILNQRTIHLSSTEYSIENGLINTDELNQVRDNIKQLLKELDNELFYYEDDGR